MTKTAWTSAFYIRLALEWFRLHEAEDPSALEFSNPQFQRQWQTFVRKYREAARPHGVQDISEAQLLAIWIEREADSMRRQREMLNPR